MAHGDIAELRERVENVAAIGDVVLALGHVNIAPYYCR